MPAGTGVSEQGSNLPPGEMTAHSGVAYGLTPYDLQAPARLLTANLHKRRNFRTRTLNLGSSLGEQATLEIATWDKCLHDCKGSPISDHEAGRSVRLQVPCDALPHCSYCECGSGHDFVLAEDQVQELLAALA